MRSRNTRSAADSESRLPPHSPEMESCVLGCVLLAPNEAMPECLASLKGKQGFYELRHQMIWIAARALWDLGKPIDLITLMEALKETGNLAAAGGFEYLTTLPDKVPSAANLSYYLEMVVEKWRLRVLIKSCVETVQKAYEVGQSPVPKAEGLIAEVQDAMFTLPAGEETGGRPLAAYGDSVKHRLDHYARGIGMITGLPTGFRTLDRFAAGMHPGEIWVIGGDPGSGKTSLVMNIAERVAVDGGSPVGVISLEMSADDLLMRMLCGRLEVNFHTLRTGYAKKEEIALLQENLPKVLDEKLTPMYVDDSSGLTLYDIRSRLRVMKRRYGIKLAVVDYLQLVSLTKEQMYLGMAAGYADVARGLQQSAKELGIPVVIVSQLSNEARKRKKGEKPKLTDFRETGAIGDVANFAGILWPSFESDEAAEAFWRAVGEHPMGEHKLPVQLQVVKNKNGPSGMGLEFTFHRWRMAFEDFQDPKRKQAEPSEL